MSFATACEEWEAAERARVMVDTWGHLEAEPGTKHKGFFVFAFGQHGDMIVIDSDFPSFGEGPGYFADREDYINEFVEENQSDPGVFCFTGIYKRFKNGNTKFVGKVRKVKLQYKKE